MADTVIVDWRFTPPLQERDGMMKVNLGCGWDKKDGYINTDKFPHTRPDQLLDIDYRFPFASDSVDEFFCSHILEHARDLVFTMSEIYRCLKDGGYAHIAVPEFPCKASVLDPTHIKYILAETFFMFCNPAWFRESNCRGAGLFDIVAVERIRWQLENESEIR